MRRVVSLFLPHLAVERLRRLERPAPRLPEQRSLQLPVDDDPGACSVPRSRGWRPGARWAQADTATRGAVEQQIAALPRHAQPPMRELGRRSEPADHPFKRVAAVAQGDVRGGAVAQARAPLALIGKVERREEIVAACSAAAALGIRVGMAATHARALVSDLDFRPHEPAGDAQLLDRLALLADCGGYTARRALDRSRRVRSPSWWRGALLPAVARLLRACGLHWTRRRCRYSRCGARIGTLRPDRCHHRPTRRYDPGDIAAVDRSAAVEQYSARCRAPFRVRNYRRPAAGRARTIGAQAGSTGDRPPRSGAG